MHNFVGKMSEFSIECQDLLDNVIITKDLGNSHLENSTVDVPIKNLATAGPVIIEALSKTLE